MTSSLGALAAIVLTTAFTGGLPPPSTQPTPEVSELVVQGVLPGPAWWRVSDEDSDVYILIVPDAMPRGMDWDRSVLEHRLEGANRLLTPADLSLLSPKSMLGMAGLLIQSPKLLGAAKPPKPPKETVPLEERLPPEIRARFVAMRTELGQPAERYASMSFAVAATVIQRDYLQRQALARGQVMADIEASARRHKVRTEPAYKFTIPTVKLKVERFEEISGPECLDAAMTGVVASVAAQRRAAEAWAKGDVRPLIVPPPPAGAPACRGAGMSAMPDAKGITRLEEDFRRQQVAALERALKLPGRSIAVLSLFSPFGGGDGGAALFGRDGVLERLEAKGYEVATPASAG